MRYSSVFLLVVSLLAVSSLTSASEPLTPRPLDEVAADAFAQARAESSIVRQLVETLERSNVIVHIVSSQTMRPGLSGTTNFVASRGGYRYVRITLNVELRKSLRTSILAHELQHACELAQSDANDTDSVRRLFEQAGMREGSTYETREAQIVQRSVAREVRTATMAAVQ